MSLEKKFVRVPKEVYALQWLPFARLPHVENVMGEVVTPNAGTMMGLAYNPNDPFSPPQKPKLTCVAGKVKLGGEEHVLDPYDYVVYDCDSQLPIQVLSEKTFTSAYVESERFSLCDACASKAKALYAPPSQPSTLDEIVAVLKSGKSISLGNGKVISNLEELKAYAASMGATVNI